MNKSLEIILDNISPGLYLLETNSLRSALECINRVAGKLKTLYLDFSQGGVEFYNENIGSDIEAVVFYRFDSLEDVNAILSSCNLNRDNFIKGNIPIFFIVPAKIKNIIRTNFPNLYSYFMISIDLDERLEIPFKQIMSMDRLTFSDNFVSFHYMETLRISEIIKSKRDLIRVLKEGYIQFLDENLYTEAPKEIYSNEQLLRNFFDDAIMLNQIWIYGGKFESVIRTTLEMLRLVLGKEVVGSSNIDPVGIMAWISNLKEDYLKYEIITRMQLITFLRQLAIVMFYKKNYNFAAYLFSNLLNWMYTFDEGAMTTEEKNTIILTQIDYSVCIKKIGPQEDYLLSLQKFLNKEPDCNMQTDTYFVYRYNRLLYALISKYNIDTDEEMQYFNELQDVFTKRSPLVLRYSTLIAWMLGCYCGYLDKALGIIENSLKQSREVFPENYYVIAEMQFCKGVLFWLADIIDLSKCAIQKAINILENNKDMNGSSLETMQKFLDTKFADCGGIDK